MKYKVKTLKFIFNLPLSQKFRKVKVFYLFKGKNCKKIPLYKVMLFKGIILWTEKYP